MNAFTHVVTLILSAIVSAFVIVLFGLVARVIVELFFVGWTVFD